MSNAHQSSRSRSTLTERRFCVWRGGYLQKFMVSKAKRFRALENAALLGECKFDNQMLVVCKAIKSSANEATRPFRHHQHHYK